MTNHELMVIAAAICSYEYMKENELRYVLNEVAKIGNGCRDWSIPQAVNWIDSLNDGKEETEHEESLAQESSSTSFTISTDSGVVVGVYIPENCTYMLTEKSREIAKMAAGSLEEEAQRAQALCSFMRTMVNAAMEQTSE